MRIIPKTFQQISAPIGPVQGKGLCIVFLLIVVSSAYANPMVDSRLISSPSVRSHTNNSDESFEPVELALARIGGQITDSALFSKVIPDSEHSRARFMPAGPAAILTALMGFVCVSLVRDRKMWLMVLFAPMWLCQMGVDLVPQLLGHLGRQAHRYGQLSLEGDLAFVQNPGGVGAGLIYRSAVLQSKGGAIFSYQDRNIAKLSVRLKDKLDRYRFALPVILSIAVVMSACFILVIERIVCFVSRRTCSGSSRGPPEGYLSTMLQDLIN